MGISSFVRSFSLRARIVSISGVAIGLAALVALRVTAEDKNNSLISRLERGEIISAKQGQSVSIQAMFKAEPSKVSEAIFSDLRKLPQVFPQIAYAQPYQTKSGRRFVYLKVRGLGGLLMEVKDGAWDAFDDAKSLLDSGDLAVTRAAAPSVENGDETGLTDKLEREIEDSNAKSAEVSRSISTGQGILLEGPYNHIVEMPNVRLTIQLNVGSYTVSGGSASDAKTSAAEKSLRSRSVNGVNMLSMMGGAGSSSVPTGNYTYLTARMGFGVQVSKSELGDYRGFGEQRLSISQRLGSNVFAALRPILENL